MVLRVKDWLATTMHWPDAERGAYISLLCFQWVNGYVPTDVEQLARLMGTPADRFEALWATLGSKFEADERGLFCPALEVERRLALKTRDGRVLGAARANEVIRARKRDKRSNWSATKPEEPAAGEAALTESLMGIGTLSEQSADAQRASSLNSAGSSLSLLTLFPLGSSESSEEASEDPSPSMKGESARGENYAQNGALQAAGDVKATPRPAREPGPGALGKPIQRLSKERASFLEDKFIEFKVTYPIRIGTQPWKRAVGCWNARIRDDGYTPEQIIEGTERYAKWCEATAKARTEMVMQAATFLGPEKHFLADWELPAQAANDERWSPESDDVMDPPDGYAA
jgi:uncharacterized protein YdaU (DUF1376 family)